MTTPYEVPLSPEPQTFLVDLAGVTYRVAMRWNGAMPCWAMDLSLGDDTPLVLGLPLATGVDLLAPYAFLGIGGALVVQTDGDPDAAPTLDNLGLQGRLFFVTEP